MILQLCVHPDSSGAYNEPQGGCKAFISIQLRTTTCYKSQHPAESALGAGSRAESTDSIESLRSHAGTAEGLRSTRRGAITRGAT